MTESEAIRELESYMPKDNGYNDRDIIAFKMAITALSEIQQYREYREIFESHFTEDALELFSDKEEFSKWFERGKWHVLKCDELGREVEAYRAIGTVEELKSMKENGAFSALEMAQIVAKLNKLKEYETIGTVSEFRELKEKATAKKPKTKKYVCPNCKRTLNVTRYDTYCEICCGRLYVDWSEGKE